MSWTLPQDILDRWVGANAPTDTDLLTALIADAEAIVLAEYPAIQTRIDADELSVDVVIMVVSRMVSRVLRNPDNVSYWQQTTGPFGQARNFGENAVDIWLSGEEKQLLAPKRRGKSYEVDLGYNMLSQSDDLIWVELGDNF
jgi:hypothetical protein